MFTDWEERGCLEACDWFKERSVFPGQENGFVSTKWFKCIQMYLVHNSRASML